tara:strand:- start:2360 stop:2752 length:393 start_codon:yes stop_codon:yes gene_type:complete
MAELRLTFPDEVKRRYWVLKDEGGDEYIALRGKRALGNGGMGHIYRISEDLLGWWIDSTQAFNVYNIHKGGIHDLRLEQLGEGEAVISCPTRRLHDLCQAAKARTRPTGRKGSADHLKAHRFQKTRPEGV